MQLYKEILTKESIQERFIKAIYAVLRQNNSLNKASLAESLGVKPSKFSEVLNCRMKPGADMIALLCEYWDVSPDWILTSRGAVFRNYEHKPPIWIQEDLETEPPFNDSGVGDATVPAASPAVPEPSSPAIVSDLVSKIAEQAEEIGQLKERIFQLERKKGKGVSDALTSGGASAG
jgi:transcriptional regulator with XRE-family HTH domain